MDYPPVNYPPGAVLGYDGQKAGLSRLLGSAHEVVEADASDVPGRRARIGLGVQKRGSWEE